jgi:hypothetical protein
MSERVRLRASITDSIQQKAERVRQAADGVTARIEKFEEWLNRLPGRTETVTYVRHPEARDQDDMTAFGIRLARANKRWALSYASWEIDDPDEPINWQPLTEASLKLKLHALRMFPTLLESIEKSQQELVNEIEAATKEFDAFAETLGVHGEGKQ